MASSDGRSDWTETLTAAYQWAATSGRAAEMVRLTRHEIYRGLSMRNHHAWRQILAVLARCELRAAKEWDGEE